MLKIAHISDLHFCDASLAKAPQAFSRNLNAQLASIVQADVLDIHVASPEVLEALRSEIIRQDPDIVVVSGDVTTSETKRASTSSCSGPNLSPRVVGNALIVPGSSFQGITMH